MLNPRDKEIGEERNTRKNKGTQGPETEKEWCTPQVKRLQIWGYFSPCAQEKQTRMFFGFLRAIHRLP